MKFEIVVVDRKEGEILHENVLSWTKTEFRDHLAFRWKESDGTEKVLHIAISGFIKSIDASVSIKES